MSELFAATVKEPVQQLGGGFMLSRYARAAAEEHGLTDRWASYFIGRGGVLGDVDPDVVAAAAGFFPADVVRTSWATGRAAVDPVKGAARYAEACDAWGRARLAGYAGAERLAELALAVVATVDPPGLPLLVGWRAMPIPSDPEARCARALNLLREHRGGAHLVAVLATGLTPRQAVLAGAGGEGNAAFLGWQPPYEDVSALAGLRRDAEELTDRIVEPAYEVLDDGQQAELTALLAGAAAHVASTR